MARTAVSEGAGRTTQIAEALSKISFLFRSVDLQRNLRRRAARDIRYESERARTVLKSKPRLLRAAFEFSPRARDLAHTHRLADPELRRGICLLRKEIFHET